LYSTNGTETRHTIYVDALTALDALIIRRDPELLFFEPGWASRLYLEDETYLDGYAILQFIAPFINANVIEPERRRALLLERARHFYDSREHTEPAAVDRF